MKVVIIGGTGLLGWFTCKELLERGHTVVAVGLSQPEQGSMPDAVETVVMDINSASDEDLARLLDGADALVHAAGADGRAMYDAPAIAGFRESNVLPFERLLPQMRQNGVSRLVIFGSYYTALDRIHPELAISARNAYPMARREQAELAFQLAGDDISVAVLELPYIFGAAPGRGTLWGFYIEALQKTEGPFPVAPGGSACVTAKQVAQAAAGACERSTGCRNYPIADSNLSYRQIYGLFADALGITVTFVDADAAMAQEKAEQQQQRMKEAGKETGYDPHDVALWQEIKLYLDPLPAMQALGYEKDDLAAAIKATVAATLALGGKGPAKI
jgi:nucleoside-diphosphate-sugar epimerase